MGAMKDHNVMAIEACEALARAYASAGESGSVEWSDVDEAHQLALKALEALSEAD